MMFSSSLVSAATALWLLANAADATYINYTTVTGYFLQDDASTSPSTFDYVIPSEMHVLYTWLIVLDCDKLRPEESDLRY